jgi:AcrR family transcriptional regulator
MGGRERILEAASRHFGDKPYAEVSIGPILSDAGVQAPTLYYHFQDKEDLYVAWAELAFAPLKERLLIRQQSSLEAGLAAFASIYFISARFDVPQVVRDMDQLAREDSRQKAYDAYFQSVYEPLCAILAEGMDAGELAPQPIGPLADLYLAGVHSLKATAEKDPAAIASWYAERFLHGHHA